jgi:hypothetical protein
MRKLALPMTAALALAAAAVPAAAGADPGPTPPATVQNDTALRPTAVEYAVMLAVASHPTGPASDPAPSFGVLDPDDDPAFDPGFGGGSLGPGAITPPVTTAGEDDPLESAPASGG